MLSENELVDLCHKYQTHKLAESEFQLLQSWVNESEENLRFFSNYVKLYKSEKRIEANQHADAAKGWTIIERKLKQHRLRRKLYYTAVAACFLSFLLGTAVYLYTYQDSSLPVEEPSLAELFPNLPQNKVTLTLSSGQQIVLDEEQAKEIADNGKVVAQGSNNSLSYQPDNTPASSIQYNTITVPEGSTFSLTLSDGTQVTLNSTTTFRYPVSMQDKRIVELNGEAYFDVTHTGKPFTVKADGKEIKVLGTQFNVSAYHSRNMITTLVKGKVEVKNGIASKLLAPGQQATISPEDNAITVEEVNTAIYTSWVTGIYEFSRTPLHNILSQFELWYGVKVVYKAEDARNICFDGAVFRNKPLGFSLEIIQQVSNVRFSKENGTIIVSK
jgi:transmembrane sensor